MRLVRELTIGHTSKKRLAAILDVVGRHAPPTLRALTISGEIPLASHAPVDALLRRATHLELRSGVRASCMEQLRSTPLPRLRQLALSCDDDSLPALASLLARDDLDALRVLHLDTPIDEPLLDVLAMAPFAIGAPPARNRALKFLVVD